MSSNKSVGLNFLTILFFFLAAFLFTSAFALSFSDLTNQDAGAGLKAALDKGSMAAIGKLGAQDGFLSNDKVKIQLPARLEQIRPMLKMTGHAQQLDELVVSMNRAAEAAIPMAKPLLIDAVKSMTLTDAKNILLGGETSVTDFFRQKTTAPLRTKFLPLVKGVTDKAGLSAKYNAVMGKVQKFAAVSEQDATVEAYVTQRAMDGLYLMIAEEEKAIRQDPIGSGSKIIGKVFGLIK